MLIGLLAVLTPEAGLRSDRHAHHLAREDTHSLCQLRISCAGVYDVMCEMMRRPLLLRLHLPDAELDLVEFTLLLPEDFVVYLCAVDREALLLRHCCDKIGNLRCTPPSRRCCF
jgi:hypothetical protein